MLYGKVRKRAGEIIRDLCKQWDLEIIEGHAMPDHIHACISIPPKYSVANAIGFLKGSDCIVSLEQWEWGSIFGYGDTMSAQWV